MTDRATMSESTGSDPEFASLSLAEQDIGLLAQPELRPVRMQLELLKPEMALAEHRRSARRSWSSAARKIREQSEAESDLRLGPQSAAAEAPDDPQLARAVAASETAVGEVATITTTAREFARLVSSCGQRPDSEIHYVVVTGGGPGIMEAAQPRRLRRRREVDRAEHLGCPPSRFPIRYITPDLCFQFHYFAMRKLHFLLARQALVVFPGGFGTMDELFDALTLRQTHRMQEIPIMLFGREYWNRVIDFQFLADEGVIEDEHLRLISYAESPQEIIELLKQGPLAPSARPGVQARAGQPSQAPLVTCRSTH